jgi:hypothetical protein
MQPPPSNWEPPPAPWVPGSKQEPPPDPGLGRRIAIGVAIAVGVLILATVGAAAKASKKTSTTADLPQPDVSRDAGVLADDILAGRTDFYAFRRVAISGIASRSAGRTVTFDGRPKMRIPATMRAAAAMPRTPGRVDLNCNATKRGAALVFDDCF